MSDDIYGELIAYDPEIHPRDSRDYPGKRVRNTEDFITKAQWVHGVGRYDYSEVVYTKAPEKVLITCHAEKHEPWTFKMSAADHANKGNGCSKCSGKYRWTTEEWIENAKKVWGDDEFDYTGVEYKSAFTRITITHKCGHTFDVTPDNHARGKGCPKCKKTKPPKYTSDQYIEEVKKVHGDWFDFSAVEYKNLHKHIELRCRKHDIRFDAIPYMVLNEDFCGCPFCRGISHVNPNRKRTTKISKDDWITDAQLIHGGMYDYSYVEEWPKGKQKIYCPTHDRFFSLSYTEHVNKQTMCSPCAMDATHKLSKDDFISRCEEVHQGKGYDLSLVDYQGWDSIIKVRCIEHDHIFTPRAWDFSDGRVDCPICTGSKRDTASFIREAKEIHGNKFSYVQTEYVDTLTKVKVYCNFHGEYFKQDPLTHLSSIHACPICANERTGKGHNSHTLPEHLHDKNSIVYHVKITNLHTGHTFNKVGITIHDVKHRFKLAHIDGYSVEELQVIHVPLIKAMIIEEHLLECLRDLDVMYREHELKNTYIGGWTECYKICDKSVDFVYVFFDTFEE